MELEVIGYIHNKYTEKFGIPRQSGLVDVYSKITFEDKYCDFNAFRGIEDYSHLWLLWGFSKADKNGGRWQPMVKPPRLNGNKKMGVFATRSPYRPNQIGMSSVELIELKNENKKPVLIVRGADLLDNTPIYDIKPYLRYTDSHENAKSGFADQYVDYRLEVVIPEKFKNLIPEDIYDDVVKLLSLDPRPSYIEADDRIYGMNYANIDFRFKVCENVLTLCEIEDFR